MFTTGEAIGSYVVTRELGEGRVGTLFEAEHYTTGLRHNVLVMQVTAGSLPTRLVRQFGLRHPNILEVRGAIDAGGFLTLLVEPFAGSPLTESIDSLSTDDALTLFADILQAVAAGHEAGVLHLDVHPDNVLLGSSPYGGRIAKVANFYMAKLVEDEEKNSRQVFSRFWAPEMFTADDAADERADVFSLGALLYELIAKQPAFGGDVVTSLRARATGDYVPLFDRAPHVPPHVSEAIDIALSPKRGDRFSSCVQFGRTLFGEAFQLVLAERALEVPRAHRTTEPGPPERQKTPTVPPRERAAEPSPDDPNNIELDVPIPAWVMPVVLFAVLLLGFVGLSHSAITEINAAKRVTVDTLSAVETSLADRDDLVQDLIAAGANEQVLKKAVNDYNAATSETRAEAADELYTALTAQVTRLQADPDTKGAANRIELRLNRVQRSLDSHRLAVKIWDETSRSWKGQALTSVGVVDGPSSQTLAFIDS